MSAPLRGKLSDIHAPYPVQELSFQDQLSGVLIHQKGVSGMGHVQVQITLRQPSAQNGAFLILLLKLLHQPLVALLVPGLPIEHFPLGRLSRGWLQIEEAQLLLFLVPAHASPTKVFLALTGSPAPAPV